MLHGVPKNEPKMTQNEAKDTPKRLQEASKRPKKVIPNRKTKKGPNQDDPKTVLDPPGGGVPPVWCHPRGSIWEAKTAPRATPKRSKIEANKQDEKKPIQDDLGPILERSWFDLGPILGSIWAKNHWKTQCFVNIRVFEDKSVRRRFRMFPY